MVQLFISKQLFFLKLVNYIAVEERGKNGMYLLTKVTEISIVGRSFVCLFVLWPFQSRHNFSTSFAVHAPDGFFFPQYFIFLIHIFTASILHMAGGCVCFLLICKISNYTLTPPGSWPKFHEANVMIQCIFLVGNSRNNQIIPIH